LRKEHKLQVFRNKIPKNILQPYRSTGRSFTLAMSFRISPNDSTVCVFDSAGHKLVAFGLLVTVRTGNSDSGRGGGSGGGSGGGGGAKCAGGSEADGGMAQLTVSSLSTN
jgi:hypothetical protein